MTQVQQTEREVVERVGLLKEALSQKLLDISLGESDAKKGGFYFVLSSILRKLEVVYVPDPTLVLATDGEKLYVGPLYSKVERKYGLKVVSLMVLHEVLHVAYGHPYRMKLADDPALFNIVADLYVNTLLERRFFTLPDDFVTLRSFVKFVESWYGSKLSGEQRDAVRRLAELEVGDVLTVEKVYEVISSLPKEVREDLKQRLGRGYFFGHDIVVPGGFRVKPGASGGTGAGQRMEGEGGGSGTESGETQRGPEAGEGGAASEKSGEEQSGEGGVEQIDVGEAARRGEEVIGKLRDVRDGLRRLLEEVNEALGEYKSIRKSLGIDDASSVVGARGAGYGTLPGVMGVHEYRQIRALALPLEVLFLREVGETCGDTMVTYSRFDDDAYWLPAIEERRRKRILALVDSSPSIPRIHLDMFLSMIERTVRQFNLEVDMVVFSVGEVDRKLLTPRNIDKTVLSVRRGLGTVWTSDIAERIREAMQRGVRLIVVLSDFELGVDPSVYEAIKWFKVRGGRISCYSTTHEFLEFCDFKHPLPELPIGGHRGSSASLSLQ